MTYIIDWSRTNSGEYFVKVRHEETGIMEHRTCTKDHKNMYGTRNIEDDLIEEIRIKLDEASEIASGLTRHLTHK